MTPTLSVDAVHARSIWLLLAAVCGHVRRCRRRLACPLRPGHPAGSPPSHAENENNRGIFADPDVAGSIEPVGRVHELRDVIPEDFEHVPQGGR